MIPYAQTDLFTPDELETYEAVQELVKRIPDGPKPDSVRCHEVARIVVGMFSDTLEWRDGEYTVGLAHSWCIFKNQVLEYNGHTHRIIILDPYASHALPQVQIINVGYMVKNKNPYIESCLFGDPVDDEWVRLVIEKLKPEPKEYGCKCKPPLSVSDQLHNDANCPKHGYV